MKVGGPLFLGASLLLTLSSGTLIKSTPPKPQGDGGALGDLGSGFSSSTPPSNNNPNNPNNPDGSQPPNSPLEGSGGTEGEGTDRGWRGYVPTDVEALRAQLPPQAKHLAESFISAGQTYGVDPLFLASISKLETGNWTSSAFNNKNNAMGISNSAGPTFQNSHHSSIMSQAASLTGAPGTAGFYNGLNTVGEVGVKYAPDGAANDFKGTNSQWGVNVGRNFDSLAGSVRGG